MTRAITIRFAAPKDAGLVLRLIRALAVYEKAPEAVVATEADLVRYGFGPDPQFEAILAFVDDEPAGLALFHSNSPPGSASRGCISKTSTSPKRRAGSASAAD